MTKKIKPLIITFGLGGQTLVTDNARLSGYEDPVTFLQKLNDGEYAEYDLDNVPVLDARDAYKKKPSLAIHEPLVGREFQQAPVPSSVMALAVSQWGATGAELVRNACRTSPVNADDLSSLGGCDTVTPNTYLAWWRKFGITHGAKIGVLKLSPEPTICWE